MIMIIPLWTEHIPILAGFCVVCSGAAAVLARSSVLVLALAEAGSKQY